MYRNEEENRYIFFLSSIFWYPRVRCVYLLFCVATRDDDYYVVSHSTAPFPLLFLWWCFLLEKRMQWMLHKLLKKGDISEHSSNCSRTIQKKSIIADKSNVKQTKKKCAHNNDFFSLRRLSSFFSTQDI